MALGAAFHGANVSTAFRVRHVGLTDVNPFEIAISLNDLKVEKNATEGEKEGGILGSLFGVKKSEDGEGEEAKEETTEEVEEEEWSKNAVLFTSFGKIGIKKSIAFTHDKEVLCSLDYTDNDVLPEGTEKAIERYNITGIAEFAQEMAAKNLSKPKVNLQFELSSSGITKLIKAEASCEEMVMVDEQVEVDDDEEDDNATNTTEAEGEEAAEDKKEEKTEKALPSSSSCSSTMTISSQEASALISLVIPLELNSNCRLTFGLERFLAAISCANSAIPVILYLSIAFSVPSGNTSLSV